jgi:NitT/TauT family transport system substrate-binding protein
MHKLAMTRLIVVSFIVVLWIACTPDNEKKAVSGREPITIAVTPWLGSAPIFVAAEKGYFRDEGLDVTLQIYPSGHLCVDAILAGTADLATAAETPIARAALAQKPLAVIGSIARVDNAIQIIARKDRHISMSVDLKGKRIGMVSGTTADYFLHVYLVTSYIDPKEIQIVDYTADRIVAALISGEVDAVCTWSPHTNALKEQLGDNALVLGDPTIYRMAWNLAATRDFVQSRPAAVRKFLRAVIKANRFIEEQPAQAHAISTRQMRPQDDLIEKEWHNARFGLTLDQSLILNLEDHARWLIKGDPETKTPTPNFLDFINTDGLQAVNPDAVTIIGR